MPTRPLICARRPSSTLIKASPRQRVSPFGAGAIAANKDEIYTGLDDVVTVHFARFVIVGANICMFSVYDGDFANYIRGPSGCAYPAELTALRHV